MVYVGTEEPDGSFRSGSGRLKNRQTVIEHRFG